MAGVTRQFPAKHCGLLPQRSEEDGLERRGHVRSPVYGSRDGTLRRRLRSYVFGQPACRYRPEHDIEAALERWVEQGAAPEQVVATKVKAGAILRWWCVCDAMRLSVDGPLEGQREYG